MKSADSKRWRVRAHKKALRTYTDSCFHVREPRFTLPCQPHGTDLKAHIQLKGIMTEEKGGVKLSARFVLVKGAAAVILDFRPLLCLDFLIITAAAVEIQT
ncbi:hypothetical protein MKZ24_13460 [Paenibacillus sp. FSL R7-0297]|uniref:hypothetical protein n=1 Tax=Paenibacillus sp. FSL R7-0297 TaxID=2921680 RepID=UPI0030F95377